MRSKRRGKWAPASPSQPAGALSGPQATGDMFRQKGPPRVKAQDLGSPRAMPRSPSPAHPCSANLLLGQPGVARQLSAHLQAQLADPRVVRHDSQRVPKELWAGAPAVRGQERSPLPGWLGRGLRPRGVTCSDPGWSHATAPHGQQMTLEPLQSTLWAAKGALALAEGRTEASRQKLGAPGTRWPVPSG